MRQEVGRREVRLRAGVELRIQARVVRPGVQVAAGERQRRRRGAGTCAAKRCGRKSDTVDLTELGERSVLDVAAVEAEGRGLRGRLLLEVARRRQLHRASR